MMLVYNLFFEWRERETGHLLLSCVLATLHIRFKTSEVCILAYLRDNIWQNMAVIDVDDSVHGVCFC